MAQIHNVVVHITARCFHIRMAKQFLDTARLMRPAGSEKVTVTSLHMRDLSVVLTPDMHPGGAAVNLRVMAGKFEQRVQEAEGEPNGAV